MPIDYSVYLVTDRDLARARPTLDIVAQAIQGGVSCVQMREKNCDTRSFITEALAIRDALRHHQVPLIINDRIDVALAVEADGVHLGQSDMPCRLAKQILPREMIVGISAESLKDAIAAEKDGADYVGVSPLFTTATKTDTAAPVGLAGLRRIRERVKLPLVAIGGLNAANAAEAIRHGADGVAVVSAIVAAANPAAATQQLVEIVKATKRAEYC